MNTIIEARKKRIARFNTLPEIDIKPHPSDNLHKSKSTGDIWAPTPSRIGQVRHTVAQVKTTNAHTPDKSGCVSPDQNLANHTRSVAQSERRLKQSGKNAENTSQSVDIVDEVANSAPSGLVVPLSKKRALKTELNGPQALMAVQEEDDMVSSDLLHMDRETNALDM